MRSMDSPRHLHRPLYPLSIPLCSHIHPQPLLLQMMSHHLSASYVLAHHVRSFFYHVATLLRVKNAPLTWSNSALGVQSCTRRSPLRTLVHSQLRLLKHPPLMTPDLQQWRPDLLKIVQVQVPCLRMLQAIRIRLLLNHLKQLRNLPGMKTRWHHQRQPPQARPHRYHHLYLFHRTRAASDAPRVGLALFVVNVSVQTYLTLLTNVL